MFICSQVERVAPRFPGSNCRNPDAAAVQAKSTKRRHAPLEQDAARYRNGRIDCEIADVRDNVAWPNERAPVGASKSIRILIGEYIKVMAAGGRIWKPRLAGRVQLFAPRARPPIRADKAATGYPIARKGDARYYKERNHPIFTNADRSALYCRAN